MSLPVGFVLGLLTGWLLWRTGAEMFRRATFRRTNYRGRELSTAVGLAVPLALYAAGAVMSVLIALGASPAREATLSLTLTGVAVGGFGLLGLLDDLAVDRDTSGYAGHVRALLAGRLSAGSLKMLAGPAIALVVVQPVSGDSLPWLLVDGAVVALAANTANLFDRAPGRVTKLAVVSFAALLVSSLVSTGGRVPSLLGAGVALGAALALLAPELREELMLGDTGANALGAALGLGVVLTQSRIVTATVAGVLVGLNLVSERVSFSRVIERVGPLRALDRLGRRPDTDEESHGEGRS
jgi:UDP-N-acetylmuramyl pentapeptide phosphotransferase/UDP-N-acetylglucosamine-1-phosphate transferase